MVEYDKLVSKMQNDYTDEMEKYLIEMAAEIQDGSELLKKL